MIPSNGKNIQPSGWMPDWKEAILMSITLNVVLCVVLAVVAIGVSLYKKWLEDHDDHYIHLHNDSLDMRTISTQTLMDKRIAGLEKTTRYLIIAVVIYALAICGMALYSAWNVPGV
jgi:hypothetical protein